MALTRQRARMSGRFTEEATSANRELNHDFIDFICCPACLTCGNIDYSSFSSADNMPPHSTPPQTPTCTIASVVAGGQHL